MKVVSYNIMFHDIHSDLRLDMLIYLLRHLKPDIICLQEVTEKSLEKLHNSLENYNYIRMNRSRYFEVVFYTSDYTAVDYKMLALPSEFGRAITTIVFQKDYRIFNVTTFHLESLDRSETRVKQLNILKNLVDGIEMPIICCGDTNLKDGEIGLDDITNFGDVWKILGSPERAAITSHGDRYFGTDVKERYDRFWTSGFHVKSLTILGRKPIDNVWISDHDGLLCDLVF